MERMTGLARLRCPLADTPTVFLTVHRTVKIRLRRTDLFEPPFSKKQKNNGHPIGYPLFFWSG